MAVSGSLWLAWAVQSTFQQADWSGGTDGGAMTLLMLMAMGTMIGSGMFVSAWPPLASLADGGDVDYIPGKVNNDPGFFEEIKPQQAFDGTLRGKIVADDLQISDLNSKGPEFGDSDKRDVFNAASRGYFNFTPRAHRVAACGDSGFNGDHGVRGPGIHGHFKRKFNAMAGDFRVAENEPPCNKIAGYLLKDSEGSFFEAEYPTLLRSNTSLRFVFELRRVLLSPSFSFVRRRRTSENSSSKPWRRRTSPRQAAGYSAK